MNRLLGLALLVSALFVLAPPTSYADDGVPPRAVVERRAIGTSVAGRPIRACA